MCVKCEGLEIGTNHESIKVTGLEVSGKDQVELVLKILQSANKVRKNQCMHVDDNGMVLLSQNEDGTLQCSRCKTVFSDSDLNAEEITKMVTKLINSIEIIKVTSALCGDLSDKTKNILSDMMEFLDNVSELPTIAEKAKRSFEFLEQKQLVDMAFGLNGKYAYYKNNPYYGNPGKSKK